MNLQMNITIGFTKKHYSIAKIANASDIRK